MAFNPERGARIESLSWRGHEFLTSAPAVFRPPEKDCGLYETHPVYGYDDCFPSVDACVCPDSGASIPDHGALWQIPWDFRVSGDSVTFSAKPEFPNAVFTRKMTFGESDLKWSFSVQNLSVDKPLFFNHVMHPLMPLDSVAGLCLPDCGSVFDEARNEPVPGAKAEDAAETLLSVSDGRSEMLILRGIKNGEFKIRFKAGFELKVNFPAEIFGSLALWWNKGGWPPGPGSKRREFAIEPLAGPFSSLAKNRALGQCQSAPPAGTATHETVWTAHC
jgi:hypothetical protein